MKQIPLDSESLEKAKSIAGVNRLIIF